MVSENFTLAALPAKGFHCVACSLRFVLWKRTVKLIQEKIMFGKKKVAAILAGLALAQPAAAALITQRAAGPQQRCRAPRSGRHE
jgi:hypothetical protein